MQLGTSNDASRVIDQQNQMAAQASQFNQEKFVKQKITQLDVMLSFKEKEQINKIYKNLLPNLNKQYHLILIDCPWKFNNQKSPFAKYSPPYKCLTFDELKILPIKYISASDCVLLMWVIQSFEEQAQRLLKHFGFTNHKDLIIWGKTKNGKIVGNEGSYSIVNTEKLWICTKGNIKRFLTDYKIRQLQITDITSHSTKPQLILDKIKQRFRLDKMNCIEFFARNRYLKEFDLYGDALQPNFQASQQNAQSINFLSLSPMEKEQRITIILNQISNQEYKKQFIKLLEKYIQIFAFSKQEFGLTNVIQHDINLTKDAQAIAKQPYKVSFNEEQFIKKEIDLLLKLDCIEESKSDWALPIVLVRKASGDLRLCIDYRSLNKVTQRDEYPLPRIDVILNKVATGKIFSRLDLKSGFWQVAVNTQDKYKTSFTSTLGTFQWKRMPFGLTNAPATFQRLMDKILKPFINEFCCVYIDDIIIYSENLDQHLKHLQLIFKTLQENNLRLGFDKCEFFKESIQVLGHVVYNYKYSPLKSRTDAITNMQAPKDKKGVMSFLGLVNYYGSFIQRLAIKAKPLRELTKLNAHFKWTNVEQQAFDTLKAEIAKETFLHIPQPNKLMVLYTDFSEYGLGAVLAQRIEDKQERVIEFASRTLKRHEINYPAYKGEILAINWAMQKFRFYLLQAPFLLIIDNLAAVQLLESIKMSSTLNSLQKSVLRWIMQIQEFSFNPIHRQGIKHNNADALSRLPQNEIDISCLNLLQAQFKYEVIPNDIFYLQYTSNEDLRCKLCEKLQPEENMIICECCGYAYHSTCHKPRVKYLPKGAWYCSQCLQEISQMQILDLTLNFPLIQYLKDSTLPDEMIDLDKESIRHEALSLYIDEHDRLVKITPRGERVIPTIVERKMILNETHHLSGHLSIENFISLISNEYFWQTMRKDIEKFCLQCETCIQFNPKFRDHPQLHPIEKGSRPCATWVIDLTSNMNDSNEQPYMPQVNTRSQKLVAQEIEQGNRISKKGNKFLIIAIDPFSKWVEISPLPNKNSDTILFFFIDSIMKRFGIPQTIRTDQGTEFQGSFHVFLEDSRIQHIQVSRAYPKANGQVERTIRTIKSSIKKFYNQPTNQMEWDDSCPIIQMTLNAIAQYSTKYSPHEILFGRPMNYPSSIVIQPPIHPYNDPSQAEVDQYVRSLKAIHKQLYPTIKQNIQIADDRNKRIYDAKQHKPQSEFSKGDIVYVKLLRTNKHRYPTRGPYMFLQYTNDKLNANLQQMFGKQLVVNESTANICLYQQNQTNQEQDEE